MTIGCAMIVRDGGATIEETIASVRPHVDQVAVWVDERTRDDTVAVLERLSAQHGTPLTFATGTFEWFAQARNESFDLVDSAHEWIIWLDDDVLVHGENLPGLVAHASPDAQCITVSYDYFDLSDGSAWITKRSRVARRGAVKWEGAIHEDLVPVPARSVLITASVLQHGLSVRHLRRDPRPPGHYLQEIVAATDDLDRTPHAFLYLGKELLEVGRPEEAAAALKQYLAERHDLRTAPEYNWARVEALERFAEAQKQLGDESMAAAFQAQAVTERTAADEHMASLLRDLSKPAINEPKVGRNDPCPCGSGKKYKRCHGA